MSEESNGTSIIEAQKSQENRLIGIALMLATVNECTCKVCKILRKAQKAVIEAKVGELGLD